MFKLFWPFLAAVIGLIIWAFIVDQQHYNKWVTDCLSHEGYHVIKTGESVHYSTDSKGYPTSSTTDHMACTNATGVTQSTRDH